ncbi:hypothetical protein FNZ56_04585 [Pseudoluteimonas lycopersici]|uniref:Uncharacterized protein n=1 Tax=Pseudoluteimonas lycopersici TaxID=1324796 RepID=A0A516V3U0_9GAMM|nr:hypothetical protein [Lysobacter lycopersici]QDQ73196.1 hypothetical protein FNZ56_04585 [Lysobacter lycopersici]
MDEKAAEALNTSLTASRILSLGASRISASLDVFSGWLLAGFGATYGLLLANLGSLAPYIDTSNVKFGAMYFVVSASLAAAQKLIASYVAAGTAAGEEGRATGKELANSRVPIDVESMYQQVNQGLLWPWSTFNARMTDKARKGDYAVIGRFHAKASQIQTYLVVFQVITSLISAVFLINGILV